MFLAMYVPSSPSNLDWEKSSRGSSGIKIWLGGHKLEKHPETMIWGWAIKPIRYSKETQ